MTLLLAAAILLSGGAEPLGAQVVMPPDQGGVTYELGMPPVWKGHAGATMGWHRPAAAGDGELTTMAHFGLLKDLGSPVVGMAAIGAEGYAGYRGDGDLEGGVRGLFTIPVLHFTLGADYNIRDENLDVLLRLEIPFRRSGIFGRGSQVRLDWLPGRDQTFAAGINVPLWGRNIGKTRPQRDGVELAEPPARQLELATRSAGLDAALDSVAEGATWVIRGVMPLVDRGTGDERRKHSPGFDEIADRLRVRDLPAEVEAYHDMLDRAFSIAATGADATVEQGRTLAAGARAHLLEYVLFPYNRLLGQRKDNDGLAQFSAVATVEFVRWFGSRYELPEPRAAEVAFVFQRLLVIVDSARSGLRDRWGDSRMVWLPLQLALRADAHDTQGEVDGIIERITGRQFTRGNRTWYVMNERFQFELARSIHAAERYHVLWIHDFRGLNGRGLPDTVAFEQVITSYIGALTRRVRAYDSTGVLPEYFVFLDQHYFEGNRSRLWFRVLQDPMDHVPILPAGYEAWTERLRAAQAGLREAVAGSTLLQIQQGQFGDEWLRKRLRVRINITNPSDFSFNSNFVAGILPVPDNVMRDHRKIVFYDIGEEDPYRGRAIYTGMGVGEHYVGANWEDRTLIVQGPAALAVRDAARRLLEAQGFRPEEMPFPFRPRPRGPRYEAKVDSVVAVLEQFGRGWTGRVLELHNETGFAEKWIDVEKAVLYSLMPSGTVIKVPDSLWQAYLYASLLAGSALRGCRVMIVAPALESAPSSGAPAMARAHGLLSTLILFQELLNPLAVERGGFLRTGLYSTKVGVGDLAGRLEQGRDNSQGWISAMFPPNAALAAVSDSAAEIVRAAGFEPRYLVEGDAAAAPKLHLKANVFMSKSTWERVWARPEWGPVLHEYLVYLARQIQEGGRGDDATVAPRGLVTAVQRLSRALDRDDPDLIARDLTYLTVGSANMDGRSMVMDGEVMVTLSGWSTLSALVDFLILDGLSIWVETQEELDELLPPVEGLPRILADFGKLAM